MGTSNGTVLAQPGSPARRLRALLEDARSKSGSVALPGAFNALCGLAIRQTGFTGCYISGAATSVCAGVPDVGLLTAEHFCRVIREVYDATGLPILADADTGFGEAEMVRRTVLDYGQAGAAGLHLEDQKFPKRCGHLDGKELVPTDHMVEKVEWARRAADARARGDRENAMIVCARTDARGVEGLDAAVERARMYVKAGADMIFPEGLQSEAEFAAFAEALRAEARGDQHVPYLLANMTEFGKTPLISLSRFGALGYECVIYPVSMLRVAMGAVTRALADLRATGSVESSLAAMQTRKDLYGLVGYTPGVPWEARVQG